MYHPTTRVLTILEMLQSQPGLSGAAIARQLEVDRRTVRRYVAMLQELGIPIETTRGPYGGYQLRPGFKLPPLMLADNEALAVTLSLLAAQRQGMGVDATAVAGALAKIERVLPDALRERIQAVRDVIAFTVAADGPNPDTVILVQLSLAIQRGQGMQLRYQGGGAATERRVDPYGVVFHGGRWYMAAWCHLRGAMRVFRLDRVEAIEEAGTTFSRPAGFDSVQFVTESLALAPAGPEVEVLLEATLREVERQMPPGWAILEEVEGGVLLRGHYDPLEWIAIELLRFDCRVTVRRPAALTAILRVIAERAGAMAGGGLARGGAEPSG